MKYLKSMLALAACMALSASLAACSSNTTSNSSTSNSSSASASEFPYTFKQCGNSYTFAHAPKIVVDTPQAAALVAAAGGNETGRVVGYTQGGDEPLGTAASTMKNVPQLSKTAPPSKEAIASLSPDLFVTHYLDPQLASQLKSLGIQALVVNNGCQTYPQMHGNRTGYDANYSDITILGRLLGTSDYAAKSISAMKASIAGTEAKAKTLPKQKVGMLTAYSGSFYGYGSASLEHTMLASLNQTNSFADMTGSFVPLSTEKLISANPYALIVAYEPGYGTTEAQAKQALLSLPGADKLDAVKNNRVIAIDDIYLTALPADGLKTLYTQLSALK
ncbi:ABC transporter substrate-binding protein [Bifidobacterium tibiigranuli]|jgi:ABC-type Fe3+-hydroxamate transport system substrate-binding protein|uniref:ABC transporter substrate-binding protein n=1 Tax=Bifidobacterium tibiigranuli TaxID=2172043 RepID=UPI002352F9C0|nr:ABC transporter substrate-binding protein [Bifidobacterium tibiigranuli]MCH3973563.1 ABC transporter substrate-binding protein [Bifidobacterium tibiigranuli]MCI1650408.1 ABC transporter substrate-binding protein [Bifidobacterium tibiigranuli]MCI2184905.1 ABC transporter substrate-binding protein [Bifidobacterium tibiigranuli]MCI2204854.1 ABC transporter substrate-binding protein [Bifidobacterium tibiigranuli]